MSYKYLEAIRERNKQLSSKCFICKAPTTGINAYKHAIRFVCNSHLIIPDDIILDASQPGILHYTYPNGKKVPEHMMDPNIGGFRGNFK